MNCIYLKARAKINIALDITSKRPDKYHEMRMIMQSLQLYDGVFIEKTPTQSLVLECNLKWMPVDSRNLVYKAADFLIKEYEIGQGAHIQLTKNIPVSAGLGGGSSDCAATLIGMRRLFDLPITDEELAKIGKQFGADVPFCLARGTMLAEGIGEVLTPLPPHPQTHVLVARPPISISTATVFGAFDVGKVTQRPNIGQIIKYIENQDVAGIASNFCNVLETVTIGMCPMILDLKEIMRKNDSIGQLMSGSGPTVFGYFRDRQNCNDALMEIRITQPTVKEIYCTKIFNPK